MAAQPVRSLRGRLAVSWSQGRRRLGSVPVTAGALIRAVPAAAVRLGRPAAGGAAGGPHRRRQRRDPGAVEEAPIRRGLGRAAPPGIRLAHGELGELLERSVELGVIRAGAEAVAAGEGRAVVVEGPAGIGKTALVAAARAHAREVGLKPLAARGTELERAFGFGVVRQLLEPAVHDGDGTAAFEGAARYAAALLDVPLAEPAPLPLGPEGAFAVLHGLYRLTANLARRRPLALLVDDAHWADGASLRFLAYLGNRLSQVPVLLVVAARPLGEPGGAAVAEMLAEGGAPALLRPPALSDDASASSCAAPSPRP